jgi:hypothetical protein
MNDPLKIENSAAKRGTNRDSLLLKAVLRFPSTRHEDEVRIRNLSAGGLMAETPVRVSRGEAVEIHLRSIGWITGHVAWATEGRLGIAFDRPIDPKHARKPVGVNEMELPPHLRKLNEPVGANKNRRL